ncbi:MAG: hypothetical protein IJD48_02060 [Clostridia bacterium]|nr:hypothetical protein [Clostridia bacterium]
MSKTKKGLLMSGTIITIVTCSLAVIGAILLIWFGSKFTESALVEIFRSAPEVYQYETNFYYYETGLTYEYVIIDITTTPNSIMLPETIAMAAELFQLVFNVVGFVVLAFAGIKLLLSVIALATSSKKFAKGAVITLIVFSFLTLSLLEAGLLIGSLCAKNKAKTEEPAATEPQPEVIA